MLDQIQQYTLSVPDNFIDNTYKLTSIVKKQLRSNCLGWQSRQLENTDAIPWANDFLKLCLTTINAIQPIEYLWFNISPPGAFHKWHIHGGSSQAGVFYIKTPVNCGGIEFKHKEQVLCIEPHAGLLLLFPPTLEHRTLTNASNEDRITLAFNLGL
jgi:uncharacterized protein (TIGR02466 family)